MSRRLTPKQEQRIQSLLEQAVSFHRSGRLSEAVEIYKRVIAQVPEHFDANHLLGVVALQEGRFDQAQELIASALHINPKDATALNNLGMVYLRKGNLELAREQFDRTVEVQPNFVDGLANLGTVLHLMGRPHEALAPLRRAYAAKPQSAMVCNLVGACLMDTGEPHAAVKFFEAATLADADEAGGWSNLAIALNLIGELARAQECAEKAVAICPGSSAALAARAAVEFEKGEIETAVQTYRKAIAAPDPSTKTYCAFSNVLWTSGRGDEALNWLRQAVAIDANDAIARWKLVMSECRSYYNTAAEVEVSRKRFADSLEDLQMWFLSEPRAEAYRAVGSTQPFYLAYHPFNNRDLLVRYGRLCAQWMASMPRDAALDRKVQRRTVQSNSAVQRKIRIGVVSAHIRNHSVWNAITKGWIQNLNKDRFDIFLFHLGNTHDEETVQARREVTRFEEGCKTTQGWARAICAAELDALIYPEIGMDALTTQLASLRLAPVQATAWGHPETSGLPTMDLYLSAELLEPVDADGNYSERLVRLPNLGVYVQPITPAVAIPDLRSLGLPINEPLLLCPGTPFKYTPEHDHVWVSIAKGLQETGNKLTWTRIAERLRGKGNGKLVFFRSGNVHMDELVARRLRSAFEAANVDFDACACIIPRLDRAEFFGLMQMSALLLDTAGFSGFNNALQAVEAGVPVLAREGDFMRGRLASGIMRRMGLMELVATTDHAFIKAAIELTHNVSRRNQLSREIEKRRNLLFHDNEPVRALERCLIEAIGQG